MPESQMTSPMRCLPASGTMATCLLAVAGTHHIHTFRADHPWLPEFWSLLLAVGVVVLSAQFVVDMRAVKRKRGEG